VLQRLQVSAKPPPLATNSDPRAKRASAMQLLDGHHESGTVRDAFMALAGPPPAARQGAALHPGTLLMLHAGQRQAVRADPGLNETGRAKKLAGVDERFSGLITDHLAAARDALDARGDAFPVVPELGERFLPPPDRAAQLQTVMEMVREGTVDQFAGLAQQATATNDRALADVLCFEATAQMAEGARWHTRAAAESVAKIVAELQEHFSTPRSLAGEANAALTTVQTTALNTLEGAIAHPITTPPEDVIAYYANGVFQWLLPPLADADLAQRFADLLAAPLVGQPERARILVGDRLGG